MSRRGAAGGSDADSQETSRLLERIRAGDRAAFGSLFERHRAAIERFVARRMDRRLRARVDPSDVLQETQVAALNGLDGYLQRQPMPVRTWLLMTAQQQLQKTQRHHIRTSKRSVDREVSLTERPSRALASRLLGESPSKQWQRREEVERVRQALGSLSEADGEILTLRRIEGRSNEEAAALLEITPQAAKKRYFRAVLRLKDKLEEEE